MIHRTILAALFLSLFLSLSLPLSTAQALGRARATPPPAALAAPTPTALKSKTRSCGEALSSGWTSAQTRVFSAWTKSKPWLRKLMGYTVVVGVVAGAAYLMTIAASSNVPESYRFLAGVGTTICVLISARFGSPIWDQLSSVFGRWAWATANAAPKAEDNDSLEKRYGQLHGNYSSIAQWVKGEVQSYLSLTKIDVANAYRTMDAAELLNSNPDILDRALQYGVDQLADAAIRLRRRFPSIPPDDTDIRRAIWTGLTYHLKDRKAFATLLEVRIQKLDPTANSAEAKAFYQRLIRAWFEEDPAV